MRTDELVRKTQLELTEKMMLRSTPSGGLPIAFRSILTALGDKTIMKDNPFATFPAPTITGAVQDNYYIAGDSPLGEDIASMSHEPFPLVTPYEKPSVNSNEYEAVSSFKSRVSGRSMAPRYMMVQFSPLGYEYMRNMKYFPKTYNMANDRLVGLNIKSHIPAELLRTTTFRTQGKGADMYPMNPSELFYTMYEMLEYGEDIPVEKLTAFRGFDLGSPNLTVYMKPVALKTLFDIGISKFTAKIKYEFSIQHKSIVFKSFPYKMSGVVLEQRLSNLIKRKKGDFDAFQVYAEGISIHPLEDKALAISGVRFKTLDESRITKAIEILMYELIYFEYSHFAHEVDVVIENKIEQRYKLESRSVRETLIQCIQNYKDITKVKYQEEIDEIEDRIKENRIYEKVTRPYLAPHIQALLLSNDYDRNHELKAIADEYHKKDPNEYPEITIEEIKDYIWKRKGNDIVANLNKSGHEMYKNLIEGDLRLIEELKRKLDPENIIKEAKDLYLKLAKDKRYARKSPVKFVNNALDLTTKERLIDYVNLQDLGYIKTKVQVYGGQGILSTRGENLPQDALPHYTIKEIPNKKIITQEDNQFVTLSADGVARYGKQGGFQGNQIRFATREDSVGIMLTNLGRLRLHRYPLPSNLSKGLAFLPNEHAIDFINLQNHFDYKTQTVKKDSKVLIIKKTCIIKDTLSNLYQNLNDKEWAPPIEYQNITAIELYSDEDELRKMFIWSNTNKTFVRFGDIDWDFINGKGNLSEHYNPYYIISGNKKAYVDGIHLPINIVNSLLQVDLDSTKFKYDYGVPNEANKYIVHISHLEEEMSEVNKSNILEILNNKQSKEINRGELSRKGFYQLAGIAFIREI